MKKLIVYTDLDGTLLDHHDYSFEPVLPVMDRLKALDARVMAVTSKTVAELEAMDLPFPAPSPSITENGMVRIDFEGRCHVAQHYEDIITFIENLPSQYRKHFIGFNDMSVAEVVQHTGLEEAAAMLAKKRIGSEPFLWQGDEAALVALRDLAQSKGFKITQGGRFYHLMGQGDKGEAIKEMSKDYASLYKEHHIVSVALGDGPNDAQMLGVVDYGVKIPNSSGHDFEVLNPAGSVINAPEAGPRGWAAAMSDLLDQLELQL